jgi:hypothetical protein
MSNGTQRDERFFCPKCGAPYVATSDQVPTWQEGSFACTDCRAEVHRWDGHRCYFDWKMFQLKPRVS